jgi:Transcriptional regulator
MSEDKESRPARGRRRAGEPSGREMLVRSALKLFARHGYEGASLRAIASEAGVDMALAARLFGPKEKLWSAVIGHLRQSQAEYKYALQQFVTIKDSDPRRAFCGMLELFAKASVEQPDLIGFLLQEANNPGERQDVVVKYLVAPFRLDCEPIIASCIEAGILRGKKVGVVFGMISASVILPLAMPQLCGRKAGSRRRLGGEVVDEAKLLLLCDG